MIKNLFYCANYRKMALILYRLSCFKNLLLVDKQKNSFLWILVPFKQNVNHVVVMNLKSAHVNI
jgi:hypothetical protein